MNLVDILLALPLVWFLYRGYTKGLVVEISTLLALILGIYGAIHFSGLLSPFLKSALGMHEKYVDISAFILTFIGLVVVVIAVGRIVERFVDLLLLGFLNKLAGAIFGLFKGAILLSVLLFIIAYFDSSQSLIKPATKEQSLLYKPLESVAPYLFKQLDLEQYKNKIPDSGGLLEEI